MIVIDRHEGDWTVLAWGERVFKVPRELIPTKAKEGDLLLFHLSVDQEGTQARRARIRMLEEGLWKKR